MKKTEEGRGKLQDAKAKQDQLKEARQTVKALQLAVKAGQQQVSFLHEPPPDPLPGMCHAYVYHCMVPGTVTKHDSSSWQMLEDVCNPMTVQAICTGHLLCIVLQ